MSRLQVTRLDSPLARTRAQESAAPAADHAPEIPPERQPVPTGPVRRTAQLAVAPEEPQTAAAPARETMTLPDPPPLDESLELLSTRLPRSLRRSLSELTIALRARRGEHVSQKALPEQEVLALLIWLAGSADDPQRLEEISHQLDTFRARRYAQAAAVLNRS